MISASNLSLQFASSSGTATILSDLSFEISDGECVALMGPNGSGKTSLARCLNGILQPTSGTVVVDGFDTNDHAHVFEIRRRVGMVFQHPDNQMVAPTVEREIAFGLENLGVPRAEMHARVEEMLELFELKPHRQHAPAQLSGGEKQRVALAAVMAMQPKHLVFDEPTSLLDHPSRVRLFQFISGLRSSSEALNGRPVTVLLITQFPAEALFANRLMVLHQGKIVMDGPPVILFQNVEKFQRLGLQPPLEFRWHKLYSQNAGAALPIEDLILAVAE